MKNIHSDTTFASALQSFFSQRLISERNASARTIASYRDTFRLFLRYTEKRLAKPPTSLAFADLDAELVLGFLDYLENERGNSVRSRNARLAAIRSFMRYSSFLDPTSMHFIQRILAISTKRYDKPMIGFCSRDEIEAIISAPDVRTWNGHRDSVMFATLYNTGARVSEIIGLRVADVSFNHSAYIQLRGKGRKQRVIPLWKSTAKRLREWFPRIPGSPDTPVFPNRDGKPLSRSGVTQRLHLAVKTATKKCPVLKERRLSPHALRHTTAMHLLQSGVDISVIALWLGHESPATTHLYIEADLAMKERALSKVQDPKTNSVRYRPGDRLLEFLDSL